MSKVPIKPSGSLVSPVHQSTLADEFNVLSTSRSENAPDLAETSEVPAVNAQT